MNLKQAIEMVEALNDGHEDSITSLGEYDSEVCAALLNRIKELEASNKAIEDKIHYPKCWDTVAYETLSSAITELVEFSCHCDECGKC
jgi:hypothetical protein